MRGNTHAELRDAPAPLIAEQTSELPTNTAQKDSEGKIKYIGETQDSNRRKSEHERSGKLGESHNVQYKQAKPDFTVGDRPMRK